MGIPNRAYKQFIDELVEISRVSVRAKRIRDWGHSERANENAEYPLSNLEVDRKQFFLSLTASHKELVAALLEEEYSSAIHDIASYLEGKLSCDGMELKWQGENVPASPYATMHYDFVCRREGDQWPDEDAQ